MIPKELIEIDRKNILHGFVDPNEYRNSDYFQSHFFVRGDGCYLEDYNGRKWLDFRSNSGNVILGYNNKFLVNTIKNQAEKLCYTYSANVPRSLLTKNILKLIKNRDVKIMYTTSGSQAVETAIKLCRNVTGKQKILSFRHGFHGSTYGAMNATGFSSMSNWFGSLIPGHIKLPSPYCYRCIFNENFPDCDYRCIDFIHKIILDEDPDTIAGMIAEPIIRGYVIIPPPKYWERLLKILHEYDIYLIFDEIATGFYRTGKFFAYEHYLHSSKEIDVIILGKGLTSGYLPLSATIFSNKITEIYENQFLMHDFTNHGDPLSCAVACETINLLNNTKLQKHILRVSSYLKDRLRELQEKYSFIGDCRGIGLLFAIELVTDENNKAPMPSDSVANIVLRAFRQGVIIENLKNMLILMPPAVVSFEDVDYVIDTLDKCFKNIGGV